MKTKGQNTFVRFAGVSSFALLLAVSPAHAQLSQQTGVADPSRATESLRQPNMSADVSPAIDVKDVRPADAPAGAEKIKFTFQGINFDGVSVYTKAQLEAVYKNRLGSEQSLADVYTIANQIMLKYRNDGYILTQVVVPPQTIDDGSVTLRVVEGFVDKITLQKADDASSIDMGNIQTYAGQISKGGPLNVRDLERELLIINDLPGVTARSVLSPSPTVTGAADLLIVIDYDPIDGLVSLDNFGSRYLGPTQLGGNMTFNSWLGMNEAITAQTVLAPINGARELAYGSLAYEQPVGPYGTKLRFFGSVTDTDPGWDLAQFKVRGHSWTLSSGLSHPFIRSRTENLTGRLLLDWRKVKSSNIIEPTREDRIVALRAGGRYEFIDMLLGVAANTVDVELSHGLNLFGTSEKRDLNLTRARGNPQFTKVEMDVQRLQRITSSVNLLVGVRGQWANGALLSSEEFGVGGINLGRGYDPSEVVGDHGIAAKVEAQWKEPIKIQSSFVDSYQLYSFYDVGTVWNDDATTRLQKRDSIASVGVGVRMDLPYDVEAGFAVAQPLTRRVQTQNDESPKYYFNISKKF